jgi:hypothetical protein
MLGTSGLCERCQTRGAMSWSLLVPAPNDAFSRPVSSDRLAVLASALRRAWPEDETPCFPQMLMEVDEAEWQSKLSRITIRCSERLH